MAAILYMSVLQYNDTLFPAEELHVPLQRSWLSYCYNGDP